MALKTTVLYFQMQQVLILQFNIILITVGKIIYLLLTVGVGMMHCEQWIIFTYRKWYFKLECMYKPSMYREKYQNSIRVFSLARNKDCYKLVGRILAWSLVHGGPGGNFFSQTLYNAIAYSGTAKKAHLEDITDEDLRQKISKVCFNFTIFYFIG